MSIPIPQFPTKFRSVLPHEPIPNDEVGCVHLQGPFEPKKKDSEALTFWQSKPDLQRALEERFVEQYRLLGLPFSAERIEVVDEAPFTKVRLTYSSPLKSIAVQHSLRSQKISASQLFRDISLPDGKNFSSGTFQVTVVTRKPLPDNEICWNRSNPPKFRRLLHDNSDQQERDRTRFLYVSGLIVNSNIDDTSFWRIPYAAQDAIRRLFNQFDSSGLGVEVFLPRKQQEFPSTCHIGMRSARDCQEVLVKLQGESVAWIFDEEKISSGALFLDYSCVTDKSKAKSKVNFGDSQFEPGEPSRPECTSTTDHVEIPGLLVVENFICEEQEQALMAALTGPQAPWAPSQSNKSQTGAVKRLVQHYGYVFDYKTSDVLRDREQPGADCPAMPKVQEQDSMNALERAKAGHGWEVFADVIEQTRINAFEIPGSPEPVTFPNINQVTINHYKPGEGIGSHVDTPSAFADGLISISLNSGIVMEFRKVGIDAPNRKLVYLPPRSLVLMSGPARYDWEHYIVTRRTDMHQGKVLRRKPRVSLTLRTAISLEGQALPLIESHDYPPKWGSDKEDDRAGFQTPTTEKDHVHAVYDAIATQWHHTRGRRGVLWPGATQFLQQLSPGSIVADCGCGDGKYFPAIIEAGSYVIGTDISRPLLETALIRDRESGPVPEVRQVSSHREHLQERPAIAVADCMSIPLRDNSCDAAICIAVMHHLSTEARRKRCIEELARIVAVGGMINVQAWALEQEGNSRRQFAGTDVFVPFNAQPKYLDKVEKKAENIIKKHSNGTQTVAEMYSEAYDKAEFDEQKGLVVFQRYCHLYRLGEMESIVQKIKNVKLVESGYESGNHFVILQVVSS